MKSPKALLCTPITKGFLPSQLPGLYLEVPSWLSLSCWVWGTQDSQPHCMSKLPLYSDWVKMNTLVLSEAR